MSPAIAIAGVGRSGPVPRDPRSVPELVREAVELALADAGAGHDEVDAVVTASVDLTDGLTASNLAVTEVVGAVMKPETRIAADGLCAVLHGACQILAGAYRTVLVVAHGKASMAPQPALQAWAFDPITLQGLGPDFDTLAGLEARLLVAADPEAPRRWAALAARRRSDAGAPPPHAPHEVIASPLTRELAAPPADGACAVLMRAEHPGSVRWLAGGHDLAAHAPGERALGRRPGLRRAFERACDFGSLDPRARLGLVEPSCRFPHVEELVCEALGPACDGALVSPSGGLLGGDVPWAAGLGRLIDAVERLRAEPALGRALAHGAWGPAGQGQVVALLEAAA